MCWRRVRSPWLGVDSEYWWQLFVEDVIEDETFANLKRVLVAGRGRRLLAFSRLCSLDRRVWQSQEAQGVSEDEGWKALSSGGIIIKSVGRVIMDRTYLGSDAKKIDLTSHGNYCGSG